MCCFDGVLVEPEALEPTSANLIKQRASNDSSFDAHRIGDFYKIWDFLDTHELNSWPI